MACDESNHQVEAYETYFNEASVVRIKTNLTQNVNLIISENQYFIKVFFWFSLAVTKGLVVTGYLPLLNP